MKAIWWGAMFASAAVWWLTGGEVVAAPPQIEVDFLMDRIPETLGLQDPHSALAVAITTVLRDEAIVLLNREFPFIEWISATAPDGDSVPTLTFSMRAEFGIGERVYIDCSVRNRNGQVTPLDIVARDVYPAGYNAPTPSEVEMATVLNAKSTLFEMIHGKSDEWQEKLTRRIPISHRLVLSRPTDTFFILPLPVARLKADPTSVLRAEFRAKVGNSLQQDGEIELQPLQPVYESGDEFVGMQICAVRYYRYHPIEAQAWHEQIREALANLVPSTTLKVFMKKYVPRAEDPIDNEF